MALGFLWYGPFFGKSWVTLSGLSPEKMNEAKAKGMGKTFTIAFIGSLVMSYVLLHSLVFASTYLKVSGISAGLMAGFWNWLGFIAPVSLGVVLWEGKPWKLWLMNSGYYLISLMVMGVIFATWM